jgi:alpha-tubulin suppressor-like RCC1 family protein
MEYPEICKSIKQLRTPGDAQVLQVDFGEFHGICLTADGTVLTWGLEQGPEVGPHSMAMNQPVPRPVEAPQAVIAVAAGAYHSAMITRDGRLLLWGQNDKRQLGLGLEAPDHVARPHVVALSCGGEHHAVVAVSLGGFHSAGLDAAGRAFTWGDNSRGQCGQGERRVVEVPTLVALPCCRGIALGGHYSYFACGDPPRTHACGWGKDGALGFGQVCKRLLLPRVWPSNAPWQHVSVGVAHAAGIAATALA